MRRLMFFYRQLAQLVESGVSIIEALGLVCRQQGNARMKTACAKLLEYVSAGNPLSESLAQFPDIFPPLHVTIIRYSEQAGRVAQGLKSLAEFMERDYALVQSLAVGLAYPVIVLHVAMVLLPVINAATSGGSGYLRGFLAIFLPVYGLFFLIFLFYRMQRSAGFKAQADAFMLSIPWFGTFFSRIYCTRFIRALQTLCGAGLSIITAWRLSADACGNIVVTRTLQASLSVLEQGDTLTNAFIQTKLFPQEMIALVGTAEKSGSIVQTLNTIAAYSERESQVQIAIMNRIVPIVVYALIAGFIGMRIISFYTGYFSRLLAF